MSHNVTLRRPPTPPLKCDVIYRCPLRPVETVYDNINNDLNGIEIKTRCIILSKATREKIKKIEKEEKIVEGFLRWR